MRKPGGVFQAALLALFYAVVYRAPESRSLPPEKLRETLKALALAEAKEEHRKVLELSRFLLRRYPDNDRYIFKEASALDRLDPGGAAASWERYFQISPDPVDACPALGDSYERSGRGDFALDAHRRCLALQPRNTDLIFYLAHFLERHRKFDEAEALYRRGLALSAEYADMRLGLARIAFRRDRDLSSARRWVGEVLAVSPDQADALVLSARLDLYRREFARARKTLEKGLALHPKYLEFYWGLAAVWRELGDREKAGRYSAMARSLRRAGESGPRGLQAPW
ncbi:MAG: tetratricopeptide repeat protein [Elusimicrobia bacterium]|nr:tetratricopeptide repeat protein [Elusimicrobiota bacterium]